MKKTLFVILAGGEGRRLMPLTEHVPKPLLRFGPSARLIDFPLYNCAVSGACEIVVLTQYRGDMIALYLRERWWPILRRLGISLTIFPAYRTPRGRFLGTADAVYQVLLQTEGSAENVVVLASDHVYRMDYCKLVQAHRSSRAGATVAAVACSSREAHRFGILKTDTDGRIRSFIEKPSRLDGLVVPGAKPLASMGIYVFDRVLLMAYLHSNQSHPSHDFGHDILPRLVADDQAYAWLFEDPLGRPGYWRDVGDLQSYWLSHMDLLSGPAAGLFAQVDNSTLEPPVSTRDFIGRRLRSDRWIYNSLISKRSRIGDALIEDSVIGPDVVIEDGAVIERSVILDGAVVRRWAELDTALVGPGVEIQASKHDKFERVREKIKARQNRSLILPLEGEQQVTPRLALSLSGINGSDRMFANLSY